MRHYTQPVGAGLARDEAHTNSNYLTVPRNSPTIACNAAGCAASTATAGPATNVTRDHNR
jgi:hypothetical protein